MDNNYTRRDFGKIAIAGVPLISAMLGERGLFAADKPNSRIEGVQIGVISYSFYDLPVSEIVPSLVKIGLNEVELMSNHAERLADAPVVNSNLTAAAVQGGASAPPPLNAGGVLPRCANMQMKVSPVPEGGAALGGSASSQSSTTPEQDSAQQKLKDWRASTTSGTWRTVRKKFSDAGIALRILYYSMGPTITDGEIEYAFRMAEGLGVRAISSSSTVSVAKRVAPVADKYKMMWGGHGHDDISDPEQFATPEVFEKIMSFSEHIGVNVDIGHFTAAGYDPVSFIQKHHARITNLHLKDRKKSMSLGSDRTNINLNNYPWGQGDTPIKPVLQLLKEKKYDIPANIEYEYRCRATGGAVTEIAKCLAYAKDCLEQS